MLGFILASILIPLLNEVSCSPCATRPIAGASCHRQRSAHSGDNSSALNCYHIAPAQSTGFRDTYASSLTPETLPYYGFGKVFCKMWVSRGISCRNSLGKPNAGGCLDRSRGPRIHRLILLLRGGREVRQPGAHGSAAQTSGRLPRRPAIEEK